MHPRRLLPLVVLLLAALLAPVGAAQAAAKAKSCPARKGTMAKDSTGRVWHQGRSLYACTTVYGRGPRPRRLGPWTPQTKVAWDGSDAVWSVRLTRGHVSADRIYAADECGGSEDYRMTVVPDAASGARVGISWFGGWSRPFCG